MCRGRREAPPHHHSHVYYRSRHSAHSQFAQPATIAAHNAQHTTLQKHSQGVPFRIHLSHTPPCLTLSHKEYPPCLKSLTPTLSQEQRPHFQRAMSHKRVVCLPCKVRQLTATPMLVEDSLKPVPPVKLTTTDRCLLQQSAVRPTTHTQTHLAGGVQQTQAPPSLVSVYICQPSRRTVWTIAHVH